MAKNVRGYFYSCEPELTPVSIKRKLSKSIVGQNEAKTILSVAAYSHLETLRYKKEKGFRNDYVEQEKSNVIIYGPTGVGKTALLKKLAAILEVPLAIVDASSLTAAGYKGKNTLTIIKDLYLQAEGDLEKAANGIIFLDEFDKLAAGTYGRDESVNAFCTEVQEELLKVFEGVEVTFEGSDEEKHTLDSSNILFICGGAFEGLEDVIRARLGMEETSEKLVGFVPEGKDEYAGDKKALSSEELVAIPEDFIKYGFMRELVGRLPILCRFKPLGEEELYKILIYSDQAITRQLQARFAWKKNKLTFDKKALKAIAREAIKRGTGARGLRSIVERILYSTMFELPEHAVPVEVVVTADCVEQGVKPKMREI